MTSTISLSVSTIALLFALERYLNSSLKEKGNLAFRQRAADFLLGRDFRMTTWLSLDHLLEIAQKIYGRPFSLRALVISCVFAFCYNGLLFASSWLIGGDPSVGGINAFPSDLPLVSRGSYLLSLAFGFLVLAVATGIGVERHQRLINITAYRKTPSDGYYWRGEEKVILKVWQYFIINCTGMVSIGLFFTALLYPLAIMALPGPFALKGLIISFAIFIGVSLTICRTGTTIMTVPLVGLSSAVSLDSIFDGLRGSPLSAKSFWLITMMVSTLIPTCVHLLAVGGSVLMMRFTEDDRLRDMAMALKEGQIDDSSARNISFWL